MKIKLAKSELIHFVGIGGIGMSGLALIMKDLGFKIQGDMNWHNHCGIFTLPIQMASKFNVPQILHLEIFL